MPGHGSRFWLDADEPAAFELLNGAGGSEVMLIADHASNRVPRCLQALGLDGEALSGHIAWDAGTATLARRLAGLLDAPLVLSNYSRLVIDCNRAAGSSGSILAVSDGVRIPGNNDLDAGHIADRKHTLFDPYHLAIERVLDERKDKIRAVLSLHSFSPVLDGENRPWSIGVCYGQDRRLAQVMLPALARVVPGLVGDNQPYSIEEAIDYSLPRHAGSRGLPHVMLEFRRDKIEADEDARTMAELLAKTWQSLAASLPTL